MTNFVRGLILATAASAIAIVSVACESDSGSSAATGTFDAGNPSGFDGGGSSDSATDSHAVATPSPDFVWYVLDETSGTTAHDSSPNHYDMTNLENVTWGSGASFDGTGGGGTATVGASYRVPPVTITVWLTPAARADESSTQGALPPFPPNAVSDDIPGEFGFGVGLNVWTDGTPGSALSAEDVDGCNVIDGVCAANSTQNAADSGHSCTSTACDQGFVAGKEYFVAVTIAPAADGGTTTAAHVYVNGALFDDTLATVPPTAASVLLYLGRHNDDPTYATKRFYDGKMRDVRVYQRELGAPEISQLFSNGPTLHAP